MSHCCVVCTRWFKYDWDDLCVNKSQFVPVIFEPPCTLPVLFILIAGPFQLHVTIFVLKMHVNIGVHLVLQLNRTNVNNM
jgi:hypothetical protein